MSTVRTGPLRSVRLHHGDKCRHCGASIIWTVTRRGKRRPVDALPHVAGTLQVVFHETGQSPDSLDLAPELRAEAEYGSLYVAHMATCTRNQPPTEGTP